MKTKNVFKLAFLIAIGLSSCKNKNPLPDPLEAGWKGEAVCEVIEENNELRVLKCTFEPGVGHEKHYHNPHVGYTLVGGRFHHLTRGFKYWRNDVCLFDYGI